MRALLPREVGTVQTCLPTEVPSSPALSSHSLKSLGERLRATYEVAEPLPVRLTELVERLARRESRHR